MLLFVSADTFFSSDVPSALLPVANRPLISYQLEFCTTVGFEGAVIFVHAL